MLLDNLDELFLVCIERSEDQLTETIIAGYGGLLAYEQIDRSIEDELGFQLRADHIVDFPAQKSLGFRSEGLESVGVEDPLLVPECGRFVIGAWLNVLWVMAERPADILDITHPEGRRRVELLGGPEVSARQEEADLIGWRAELFGSLENAEWKGEM